MIHGKGKSLGTTIASALSVTHYTDPGLDIFPGYLENGWSAPDASFFSDAAIGVMLDFTEGTEGCQGIRRSTRV
jgi:hypothetical protein